MDISLTQDIHSITELKRNTRKILRQTHATGRPIVITVSGRPDVVLIDASTFEEQVKIGNLSRLLQEGECDVAAGRTRPIRKFLTEFKRAKKIRS